MDIRKEWRIVLAAISIGLMRFIVNLVKEPSCGWDCGFYIKHLAVTPMAEYHTFIEPLYFYVFKPLVWVGMDPLHAVRFSQFLMLPVFFYGVYILSRRIGLEPRYAALAVLAVSFASGTSRLWADTLRNFLAFSLLPYFIYWYIDDHRLKALGVAVLMGLAHRTVLLVIPVVIVYELTRGRYRDLVKVLAALLIPLVVINAFTRGNFFHPVIGVSKGLFNLIPRELAHNAFWTSKFAGYLILGSVYAAIHAEFNDARKDFLYIFFIVFLLGAVIASHFTAGRLVLVLTLPAAILTAWSYKLTVERKDKAWRYVLTFLLMSLAFTGFIGSALSQGSMDTYEMEFIQEMDSVIPVGATVATPSRLGAYADYVLGENRDTLDVNYYHYRDYGERSVKPQAHLYYGVNPFNRTAYFFDGDHWNPNSTHPLHLNRMEPNGSVNLVAVSQPRTKTLLIKPLK